MERFPGIRVRRENAAAMRGADLVVLAIKPQDAGLFAMLTEAYEAAYTKVMEFKQTVG